MTDIGKFNEDQRDCMQEIVNVAMGQAGDSLARLLEVFVTLSIPKISTLRPSEVRAALQNFVEADTVSATRQSFHNNRGDDGIRGESLVIFADSSFQELAELLAYESEELTEALEQELLLDVSNVLNGACLNGIAEQLEEELSYSAPSILGQHVSVDELFQKEQLNWETALSVEINYSLENRSFNCDLLLLMPDSAISFLASKLDELLDED
jgi:chemotaxis protein CheY-P-specific phosphatase CheC